MNENILEFRGITKQFPGVRALSDVSLSIRDGEIHGLIGENGAGKSTLMKVLMGIYQADCGEVIFDGKTEHITSPFYATSIGIGMVPQELDLNPLCVREGEYIPGQRTQGRAWLHRLEKDHRRGQTGSGDDRRVDRP